MPHLVRSRLARGGWLVAAALLAACSDSDGPAGPNPGAALDAATDLRRLLVADAAQPSARVIGLADGATVATMTLAAPASLVYATESGRFGVVQQRTADRVSFVDGGIWLQGSGAQATAVRQAPQALSFQLTDGAPTHENVNGPWVSVFMDGNGAAHLMDEREMAAGTFRSTTVSTGGGHHGGSATLLTSAGHFVVHTLPNPAGGSPRHVVVSTPQGAEVARTDECVGMHGNGATRAAVVFGCTEGMVLVRGGANGAPTVQKVLPTGDLAGLGVRAVWAGHDADVLVGRLSSPGGVTPARRVLAAIDPATGAMQALPIPENTVEHSVAVDPRTQRIVVLAATGTLYVVEGATRTLRHTIASFVPALPATGALTHGVAVAEGLAYVASPNAGEVIVLDTGTGAVVRRIAVSGQPSRLAVLGVRAAGQYRLATGS